MVLSDRTIRQYIEEGRIKIDPYDPDELQPASVDLHFDKRVLVFRNNTAGYLDLRKDSVDLTEEVEIEPDVPFMLHPGEFVLGSTLEHIEIPNDLVARLEGKSSLGRIGLLIHSTAGYVDPGWKGHLTLELTAPTCHVFRSRCITVCASARSRFSHCPHRSTAHMVLRN